MFTKFPDDLWSYLTTPTEIAVMLRLLKLCGFDGKGECFESADAFATKCGITRRTLTKVLQELENKKLITVTRRGKALNRIVITEIVRQFINRGKNFPHKENINLFNGEKFSPIPNEIERIHAKWLRKKAKGEWK